MRILVIEDEKDLRNIIKKRLVREHYSVDTCGDGEEALDYMEMTSYDGVLLDIMLPGKDGFAVLKEVRHMGNDTPILLLTARDGIEDRVKGLDLGADDYLIKPFAFEELLARIRVMMRRKPQFVTNQLKIADLTLDRDTRIVTRAGKEISLSSKEFMVLECLMRNQNIVMTRQQIEQNAWNYDYEGGSNVIDVYIRYLRKKIDAGYEKKLIHMVYRDHCTYFRNGSCFYVLLCRQSRDFSDRRRSQCGSDWIFCELSISGWNLLFIRRYSVLSGWSHVLCL